MLLALIIIPTLLVGCAVPDISRPFAGIESLVPKRAGAEKDPINLVRIFIIHGMTDHDIDYADDLVATLAKRLSLKMTAQGDSPKEVPGAPIVDGKPVSINVRSYHLSGADNYERVRVMS